MIKKINKWIPIVLAINIGLLCLTINVFMTYLHRIDIIKSAHPITGYSILEVNRGGPRRTSSVKMTYSGKEYYVGVARKQCQGEGVKGVEFYYDVQHDTVFEKNELNRRYVVFFFVTFVYSLLLWVYPEVRGRR